MRYAWAMPLSQEDEPRIQVLLRTLSITAYAMFAGVALFAAIAAGIITQQTAPSTVAGLSIPLPAIGLALALGSLAASFVIKGALLRTASPGSAGDPEAFGKALARFQRATIVALALCEGACLFLIVLSIMEGPGALPWLAGLMVPIFGMVLHFPTRLRLDQFLSDSSQVH